MLLVEVWIPETDKLWSRSTETQNLPASWTVRTEGKTLTLLRKIQISIRLQVRLERSII